MKKRKVKLPFKFIAFSIIIIVALGFTIGYLRNIVMNSDYFRVKEIMVKDSTIDKDNLSYLKGRNIFAINLKKESQFILDAYPDYTRVDLVRVLPGRLAANFVSRQPQALIKLYKYFAVDKDGILFNSLGAPEDSLLPVITGLETKIFGPKAGKKYDIKELNLALNIIKELNSNRLMKKCRVKRIDVRDIEEASLFIPLVVKSNSPSALKTSGPQEILLEVKIGQDNIKEKIIILAGLLLQTKSDLFNMKYIDLRFKEPVIKFKEKK